MQILHSSMETSCGIFLINWPLAFSVSIQICNANSCRDSIILCVLIFVRLVHLDGVVVCGNIYAISIFHQREHELTVINIVVSCMLSSFQLFSLVWAPSRLSLCSCDNSKAPPIWMYTIIHIHNHNNDSYCEWLHCVHNFTYKLEIGYIGIDIGIQTTRTLYEYNNN